MKIQCNVCETAEATVLCCADEAALCRNCDEKVHAANKLASKHQRVPLSNSNNHMPKCDICQETDGYFFCLEDRALLCRKCDVAIHTVNNLVSSHQRFLLTGVKIGLETADLVTSPSSKSTPCEKTTESSESLSGTGPVFTNSQHNEISPVQVAEAGNFATPKLPLGSSAESIQQWQFDDFFGLNDVNQNYNYIDDGSAKADSSKMANSHCSSILRALEVELDADDYLGQVPDSSSWAVPQISSPPTASGLCWPKHHNHNHHQIDTPTFVPDVCYSPIPNSYASQQTLKKRRQF
ncbi:B-box zinc finger protein 22-like [Rutidosis leptorrhynchoides]|uniref:B-box zinc finger protein 22-like n=1 Tax=Rutidosis leptorrhynchoides TaxID=125765 RepID=UPI003A992883